MIKAPQHLKMYDGMKNIVRDNYFRMTNEARYTIIYTEEYQKDPVLAIQLSLAVTLDKAIFLLADHKTNRIKKKETSQGARSEFYP